MKYFTGENHIRVSGLTDSTACVQGYFGFIEHEGFLRFDVALSGPPPLGNTLTVYNKRGTEAREKVRVK